MLRHNNGYTKQLLMILRNTLLTRSIMGTHKIINAVVSFISTLWTNTDKSKFPLRWRHNDHDSVSNHQPHGCLLNRLFRRRSKKTSKLSVTGLYAGNSPGPVNSPHKGPVTRKMFPFDYVIMPTEILAAYKSLLFICIYMYFVKLSKLSIPVMMNCSPFLTWINFNPSTDR